MKKLIAMVLVCCFALGLLAGCQDDTDVLSQEEAQKIALEALGTTEAETTSIHVHVVTYQDIPSYSFHISAGGASREVVVDVVTGDVLHIGEASH